MVATRMSGQRVDMTFKPESCLAIDWNNGQVSRPAANLASESNRGATITFCGDWYPSGKQIPSLQKNPQEFYGDLLPHLVDSDLVVVNVEGPIRILAESMIKDGPNLAIEPEILSTLSAIKCGVACLANNHMMDLGADGLENTMAALRRMGIRVTGAGMDLESAESPLVGEISGIKFAIVNVAEGEEARADVSRPGAAPLNLNSVCNRVSELSRSVNLVFVIAHAGREFIPVPPPYIQQAYRQIADAGAALVVGHHPHVPQGVEVWKGTPIFYSLGNFVLSLGNYEIELRQQGYLFKVRVSGEGLDQGQVLPYRIRSNQLELLRGEDRESFFQNMRTFSELLDPISISSVWDAYADMWFETRFSQEAKVFTRLMSWRSFLEAVSDRISIEKEKAAGWLKRFEFKVLGFGARKIASRAPTMPQQDKWPAAVLRNRFDTPAHNELYRLALQRMVEGKLGASEDWARNLLTSWKVFG